MPDFFVDVRAGLAALTSDELEALVATTHLRPAPSPGLLAWIEHACDWETNRRRGFDFRLAPPDEAVDPSDDFAAIDAAIGLHDLFAGDSGRIGVFLAAVVDCIAGRSQRQ